MSQCSPQKGIAGKLLLQNSALQNFGQAKNYMNDYDEIIGGGSFCSNNMGNVGVNAQNIDQHIKQLSSTNQIQQQDGLKSILQLAASDVHILKQHIKNIVSNCSIILRESIGNSLKSEIKNLILTVYEIFLSKYIEESELLIGNEISLILLNLGDEQAGIRRKCHQLILKYIRTYQSSEIVVKVFLSTGFKSENVRRYFIYYIRANNFPKQAYYKLQLQQIFKSWQARYILFFRSIQYNLHFINKKWIVRQKSINSFHSILVSESKIINWNSQDLVDLTVSSIVALNDDNVHVQKATEQLLVQFTKSEQFSLVSKKLPRDMFEKLKKFIEGQQLLGNIPSQYSLDPQAQYQTNYSSYASNNSMNSSIQQKQIDQLPAPFQHKFASLGQNIIQSSYQASNQNSSNSTIPKSQSSIIHKNQSAPQNNGKDSSPIKPPIMTTESITNTLDINQMRSDISLQVKNNPDLHFGFINEQIYKDLLDDKDWRARTSAVEEINSQIDNIQEFTMLFEKLEEFLEIMVKLINDTNFKISLTALSIICKISKHESFNNPKLLDQIIPQIVSKLGDSKVAIRTQVVKTMREHIRLFGQFKWLDACLQGLRTKNSNAKEEVLNLVTQLYIDLPIMCNYNWDKVLREVAPLIEDQKTKIKIKCVDCMVMVTMKNNKESCKKLLASLLNKVYNEMFLEKLQQKIIEKSQEDAYLSSHQTSIYSTNNKTNESFRQRENDLKFNFIDSQGNLAQTGAGSFHFNQKQMDADTSYTNSFRTYMTSTTPEKSKVHGQANQGQFGNGSSYNPTLQGFNQQTQYTNSQSQFGYPFEPSSSNLFGSLISPMQTQNRILSQNDVIDISLFSQSQITEDGQIFRSNNQQRDFSSYSMYRQNPNLYGNYNASGSGNKQPHSSSSSVRGFSNQDQNYQQSSLNEIGHTPDSRFSQRTTNTMSTSSNTMFPHIANSQNKGGYAGYSQGLLEISTSSSSRSAVKPGLSQSNNMNPILGISQYSGVEQLKLSRQNIRGMGGNGYENNSQNSILATPNNNQRGNSASLSSYQAQQFIQKDYSPLKSNIEDVQYSFNESKIKNQVSNLPPLAPSRKISQTEQTQIQLEDEQPSFAAPKFSKQSSDSNQDNRDVLSKPKLLKKKGNKDKEKTSEENIEQQNQKDNNIENEGEGEQDEVELEGQIESQSEEGEENNEEQEDNDDEEEEDEDQEDEQEEDEEEEEEEEEQQDEEDEELDENEDKLQNEESNSNDEQEEQENNSDNQDENSSDDQNSLRQKSESQQHQDKSMIKKKEQQSKNQKQNGETNQDKLGDNQFEKGDIILNYSTQKNLDEFTMSTFDRQIKENNSINQNNSSQVNSKLNNNFQGKVAVKNKEFNPPLNLYKGGATNNNSNINQDEQEDKTPTTYQYKPYLMKKSKRLSVDANSGSSSLPNNESNQNVNPQPSINVSTIGDSSNNNLVIKSKEYISKNPGTINEDPNENSPNSISSKVPTKNIFRRPKRNSGSISNKDEIQENEEEEEKKILKPNLRNLKKKVNLKQATPSEPSIPQQPNQKYSTFDAQKQSYLTKAELEPLQNPEQTLKHILTDLKVDDWSRQFEGLNNLRRVNQHHPDLLSNQVLLHSLITEVLKLVENLRSSLSKNAMITLTELSEKLKRGLDAESEAIITKLLKKGLDSNSFILEEVKNALITVCQNISEYKIVSIVLSKYQHKAISFKMSIALIINTLVEKSSNKLLQIKDVDKLLLVLSLYMMDSALEIRNYAKKTFSLLLSNNLNRSEIDKILVRVLTDQQYQKIKLFIEKESKNPEQLYISGTQNKAVKVMNKAGSIIIPSSNNSSQLIPSGIISNSVIAGGQQKNQSSSSSIQDDPFQTQEIDEKAMKASSMPTMKSLNLKQTQSVKQKDPQEFENIPQYFALCDNQDWKQRIEGVQKLTDLAQQYPEQLAKSKYSNKYFDEYMGLLNDSNSKVSSQALTSFLNVVNTLKTGIEGNLPVVFNSVYQAIGSSLSSNKQLGEQIYAKLTEEIEPGQIFSQLCNGASFAPIKAKQLIIKTLIDQSQEVYEKKGALFVKQINSVISKLLDENKPELRPICKQLIIKVNQIIGNQIFDGTAAAKKKMIQDLLAAAN